jgi:hypothetical protein
MQNVFEYIIIDSLFHFIYNIMEELENDSKEFLNKYNGV